MDESQLTSLLDSGLPGFSFTARDTNSLDPATGLQSSTLLSSPIDPDEVVTRSTLNVEAETGIPLPSPILSSAEDITPATDLSSSSATQDDLIGTSTQGLIVGNSEVEALAADAPIQAANILLLPDLVGQFGTITLPQSLTPGGQGQVQVRLTNQGIVPAIGSPAIDLYFSSNTTLDSSDISLGRINTNSLLLLVGQTQTYSTAVTVPTTLPSGSYYLLANIDASSVLLELNETNNLAISSNTFTLAPPVTVTANLANDTAANGTTNTDRITADATITGSATNANRLATLTAGFDTAPISSYVNITTDIAGNGSFTLSRTRLEQIYGGVLTEGSHTLHLRAQDTLGNLSTVDLNFTLDTTAPTPLTLTLDPAFDTAPVGDGRTLAETVTLTGQTEAGAIATLQTIGNSATANASGQFQFSNIALDLGTNTFIVQSTDVAGNVSGAVTTQIIRSSPGDVVTQWNNILLNAIQTDKTAPPLAARNMAIVQAAVFDAVNSIDQSYTPYYISAIAPAGASVEAAAVAAAYYTLVSLYPAQQATFDAALAQSLTAIPDGQAKTDGVLLGQRVAGAILAWRQSDGSDRPTPYTPGTEPGDWQPTPPAYQAALASHWGSVTPFALDSGDQFRPDGPPALDSADYAVDFNQVKELGRNDSTTRTADQTQIAQFWADGAGTYTPAGHWNQIAQEVSLRQGNSLIENARLLALLDVGLADAGVAAWDAKYTYNFWRPVTAIQQADTDGNPLTEADPTWTSLLTTPPFPDYVSGHSTYSGTADAILTDLLGDDLSFTNGSVGLTGVSRTFTNFTAAADEAGISRIYGGIHFNSANQDGLALGRSIGSYVVDQVIEAVPVLVQAQLANDTAPQGTTNVDTLTSDPTIAVRVLDRSRLTTLKVGLDQMETTAFADVTAEVGANGDLTLSQARLEQILGTPLVDGQHTVYLQATDTQGNLLQVQVSFTLDTAAPTVDVEVPIADGDHSTTARLIGTVTDTGSGAAPIGSVVLDGQPATNLTVDGEGEFDQALSSTPLTAGTHQVSLTAFDQAGNAVQTAVNFAVTPDEFVIGPTPSIGWGAIGADPIILGEQNSFLVQTAIDGVELGQVAGSRKLRFDVEANFDPSDTTQAIEDQLLVYLVDANGQTLLDQGEPGTPVFSLAGTKAEFTPGLVRFDGTTVEIDLTSLADQSSGRLVFQFVNLDGDMGSRIKLHNFTNEVDPTGVESPVFSRSVNRVTAGGAIDTTTLNASPDLQLQWSKVHLDAATGLYVADISVRNLGEPTGRQVAIVFADLPDGVQLLNASGVDGSGNPYINLQSAIAAGGLDKGASSDVVQIVLSNPNLLQFDLQPTVLVGADNQAPVFNAVGALTVLPGDTLEVPLLAIDPDGDRVTFSIQSDQPLPTGTLRADGTLVFNPTPEEVGNYSFTLIATDGALTTEQQVTLTVAADPVTTTRISGVIQNTDQQPLSGVLIDIGGTQVETAADGSFTLEFTGALPSDTLKVHGEGISGNYPFIAEKLPLLLGHEVYDNVNNIVVRPIYLPPLDVATAQPVDPNTDTTVTTTTIPGASVFVEAGSLLDQQGNPFTGQLSITEVPTDLTPAALPANLNPDLVVTIQPGEMVFTTPAPLSLPNRAGYAPNTLMDLWSINPITGDFDNVGTGQVSSDGSVIYTIEGGIRNSSWHFFAPPAPTPTDDPRNPEDREDCPANCDLTSQAELHSGAVIETHDLVSYQSQGATRGLTLTYDSLRADPRPIVHFGYDNLQVNASGELVARLAIQNGNFDIQIPGVAPGQYEQTIGGEHFWSLPANGGSISAALQADLSNLASGQYTYELTSGIRQFTNQGLFGSSSTTTGKVISVNSVQSIFGSGWGLAGLQELVVNADGSVLLIDGDGSELIFAASTESENAYVGAPGDFSTLERLPDGTFRRTLEDQTVYQFNARNQLELMRDRNGNETRYLYDNTGKLTSIIDPVGLETTLSYTGDRVSAIVDPANRTTYLEHDAVGNLTRIINPDETSRTWEYDQKHHMTAETDQRGYREETLYDFAGRATQGIRKDGTIVEVAPVQVQGLYRSDATIDPTAAPLAQSLGVPESLHTDGNGSVIATRLDQAGQTIVASDGAGNLPAVQRDEDNLVTRRTDGRGNPTQYVYDDQGNVIEIIDTVSGEGGTGGTQLQFEAQPEYATGNQPATVISGDWDGDGNFDLATANNNSSVSIHYGAGDGSFTPGGNYVVGGRPEALITGDVNEDGNLDLLVGIGSNDGQVMVLLGTGAGTFTPGESYVLADNSILSIALEDIDQDGNLDLIGSGYGDDEAVSVLFGRGDGSFITHNEYDTGHDVDLMVTEDIDGDSDLDLITVNTYGDSVSVLLNNGDGSFASGVTYTVGDSPEALSVGDVDGNGTLDIVTANYNSNSVSVLFGNGSGLFANRIDYAVGSRPTSVTLGDIDSNGILDIVTANYYSDNVSVLFGESNATSRNRIDFTVGSDPTDVKAQDVDGNGTLDLIVANASDSNVSVLLGDGNGAFATSINSAVEGYPDYIAIGDLNEDGAVDLVTAGYSGSVVILLGDGNGSFVTGTSYTIAGYIIDLTIADLNGDGHLDLFTIDRIGYASDAVSILLGNGDGTFSVGKSYASEYGYAIVSADMDGDGNLDLLTANGGTRISILSGNGDGSLVAREVYRIGTIPALAVEDVNNDGNVDLLAVERYSGDLSVRLGTGDGTFAPGVEYAVDSYSEAILVEDLNGDSNLDLVIDNGSGSVLVWLGAGDGTFATQASYGVLGGVGAVTVADVNGDGDLDLAVTHEFDDRVSVLLGAGDGSFADPIEFAVGSAPNSVIAVDVNGDEDLDIVTTNLGSDSISVLLNQTGVVARRFYTYDAEFDQLTSQTDELGRQTLYEIDPETGDRLSMTRVVGTVGGGDDVVISYSYTEDGQLDTETDPLGRITDYDYDEFGRLVKITFAKGTVDEAVQQFEYDAAGNQTAMINENGHRTEYVYDAMNQLVKTIEPDPDGAGVLTSPETSYTYDEVGNQVTMTDANGNVTYQAYDAMGHLVQVTEADPDGAGALTSPVTTYVYDQSGNQVAMIDPLGRQTRNQYDSRGRLVETIRADGSTIEHLYDVDNNRTGETDANGNETSSVYDSRGRLIQRIDANEQVTTFEYDAANQLIAQTDANGHRMEYRYDDLGRRITVIDGAGTLEETTSSTEYDKIGNVTQEIDGLGHETEYVYDNRDRQTQIIDALDDPGITTLTYDGVGNLLSLTDPIDNTTTFTYDALDRLTAETNELNKTRTHAYDANGNRIATVDRNNRTRIFTYDGLNRQVAENWLDSSGSAIRTITSAYDAADQLIWVSDPDSTYRFSYDALGRQIGVDNAGTPGVANVDLTYAYDEQGNLISVSDAINGQTGGTTAYSYDELDRVTQITQNGSGVSDKRVDFSYNPIGQVESINRYSDLNGTQLVTGTTYTYDPLNRLDLLTHESSTGTTTAFYDFAYDDADRITQIVDVDGTTDYSYNDRNELTEADRTDPANPDENYAYDKNGNRLNYDTGTNNRLESDGIYNYTYDDEGNLIQRTEIATGNVREFVWDYRDRLVSVIDENASGVETQQVEYTYDVMNRRLSKAIDSDGIGGGTATTTRFVYDRDNVILEFTDGALSQRYLHGTQVDQVLAQENGSGETVWHLTDHPGTVRDLVDDGGAIVNHLTYDSFGIVVAETDSSVDTRYRFTGREWDEETGLYFYRARYYDAAVGRFLSEDPIGFNGGDANLYRYVSNDPIHRLDPSGTRDVRWPFNGSVTNNSSHPVVILNSTDIADFPETLQPGQATPDASGYSKDADGVWVCQQGQWVFYEIAVGRPGFNLPSMGAEAVPSGGIGFSGDVIVTDDGVFDAASGQLSPGDPANRGRESSRSLLHGSCDDSCLDDVISGFPDASTWRPVLRGDEEFENRFERQPAGGRPFIYPGGYDYPVPLVPPTFNDLFN